MEKIKEEMWCYHCDNFWETDDYYNCKSCPNCTTEPIRICRTSSTGFVYEYEARRPEIKINRVWDYAEGGKMHKTIMVKCPSCSYPSCDDNGNNCLRNKLTTEGYLK